MRAWQSHAARGLLAGAGITGITAVCFLWLHVNDATPPALSFLLLVLYVAASGPLWMSLATSVVSALLLDFFFLPPVGTLNITDVEDWVALVAFLVVGFVASHLSSTARIREQALGRLLEFSGDAILDIDADASGAIARHVVDRFDFAYAAVWLPADDGFACHEAGSLELWRRPGPDVLRQVLERPHENGDAIERLGGDVFAFTLDRTPPVWLMRLRRGSDSFGLLAVAGRRFDPSTLNALASVVALAIERVRLLEQRQEAELARRSVEIKSALLASLSHDLRTPLTSAGTAVANLGLESLSDQQRLQQVDVARTALGRLDRLFQNILEMARVHSGGITPSERRVYAAELIEVARAQARHALAAHRLVVVDRTEGTAVHTDARLVATALAHLLENAAQYSPAGSTIRLSSLFAQDALRIVVDDEGQGFDPRDIPRAFERGYRGTEAQRYRAGTGMGLAIAHGLIQALGGETSIEASPAGGARLVLDVPAPRRFADDEGSGSAR